jgi:hypothetical protein
MGLIGFNNIFDATLNNQLLDSLVEYFDWELLQKGNYFNSSLGETSPRGFDYSKLKLTSHPHFATGKAWDGFRANWVWQSGINPSGVTAPLVGTNDAKPGLLGVYVDDVFYPSTTAGDYSHNVDYFNGRVVFDDAIPSGSKVQAEHSYKYINVLYASNLPFIREIQYRTLDKSSFFNDNTKGDYEIPNEMRIQLPAIAVEIVPSRSSRPLELGNFARKFIKTDVLFHCLAEDEMTRNKLVDIVSLQTDNHVPILDSNKIASSGAFPLNYQGFPVSGAPRYPELCSGYEDCTAILLDPRVQGMEMLNSSLFGGIVRITTEVIK